MDLFAIIGILLILVAIYLLVTGSWLWAIIVFIIGAYLLAYMPRSAVVTTI